MSAAVRLLERDIPEESLREWTEHVAAEQKTADVGTKSIVIFRLGTEWFALSTAVFQEVAEGGTIHRVPHRRTGILNGLVNVRGDLLLCIALDALLGLQAAQEGNPAREAKRTGRLMVCSREGERFAFPVSEVAGTHRYFPKSLKEVPATLAKATATFTTGVLPWEDKTVGCLDDQLLFFAVNRGLA